MCVQAQSLRHVWLFATHGLQPARLLRSCDSPGKNAGMGCHFLSRESSKPRERTHILCIRGGFFTTEPPGNPITHYKRLFFLPLGLGMCPFIVLRALLSQVLWITSPGTVFFFSVWPFPITLSSTESDLFESKIGGFSLIILLQWSVS